MAKTVIIILMLIMVGALGVGLYYLLKPPTEGATSSDNLAKALTWRIGIWVVLFGFIFISIKTGWIEPSSSPHPQKFNAEQNARIKKER